mmetsp:Transcript_1480/g.3755  ORF Transcript_1480/g.3755 Transcript_1480/m.3755 type:complete len:90 (+) Transcript_1480:38-307(+)
MSIGGVKSELGRYQVRLPDGCMLDQMVSFEDGDQGTRAGNMSLTFLQSRLIVNGDRAARSCKTNEGPLQGPTAKTKKGRCILKRGDLKS